MGAPRTSPSGANQNDIIENVSPLRGFVTLGLPDPMAYAMGYRSLAAPRLCANSPKQVEMGASTYQVTTVLGLNEPGVVVVKISDASADDRRYGSPVKLIAIKRCVAALGSRARRVKRPGQFGIENCQVGASAGAQRAAIFQTENARGVRRT